MSLRIADRMQVVRGSVIRQMAEAASKPGIISFANGNPAPESFPVEEFARISNQILTKNPLSMLQYGLTQGYPPLIETMKRHLAAQRGFDFETNDLMIVSGGQQACDFAAKVLLNEGDIVITEEPSFASCYNTFRAYGAKLVGVPLEEDGMNLEMLERAIERNKERARMIYIISSFQNPVGITTSKEKREKVYDLAQRYHLAVFEDDPYFELRYAGEPIAPIKASDPDGRVLYAGSFSKVMAPSFRLGFLVYSKELATRMTVAKQTTDVHSTLLFQYITNEYMTHCDYAAHIEQSRAIYWHKSELMLGELKKKVHPSIRFTKPEGGLFLMAFLPEGQDAFPFVWKVLEAGVVCVPGAGFMIDQDQPNNAIRLCYSTSTDEEIIRGIDIFGRCSYEWLEK